MKLFGRLFRKASKVKKEERDNGYNKVAADLNSNQAPVVSVDVNQNVAPFFDDDEPQDLTSAKSPLKQSQSTYFSKPRWFNTFFRGSPSKCTTNNTKRWKLPKPLKLIQNRFRKQDTGKQVEDDGDNDDQVEVETTQNPSSFDPLNGYTREQLVDYVQTLRPRIRSYHSSNNKWLQQYIQPAELGCGAYGWVYVATDKTSNKKVALKKINLAYQDEQCLIEEVRFLLSSSMHHPNLVRGFSCFIEETILGYYLWLSMEYMAGGSLTALLGTHLTEDKMAAILKETLCGLSFLHSQVFYFCCKLF